MLLEIVLLLLDPQVDEFLREYSACLEEFVVLCKCLKRRTERLRKALDLCFLLIRQLIEIEVVRSVAVCDRIDLVKDTAVVGSSGSTTINLLKYEETGPENRIGSYDASYGHDETRLNADGTRFMLFSNFGFRIYDRDGKLIKEHSFTAEETEPGALYDQQYVREGSSDYLKLYFYDGTIDIYDGSTGEYLRTENGTVPDTNLDQTFETESFLIEAPLHGDTTIKEKKTGKELSRIDEEAYVTYATEIGTGSYFSM